MDEKFILKSITDTLTGKKVHQFMIPIRVQPPVPVVKYTFWDWLQRKPRPLPAQFETHRTLEIWPCLTSNMYRVAGNAVLLVDKMYEDHADNFQFVNDNLPLITYIVAAAIQNNHLEPEPELIEFIENNVDGEDLYTMLLAAFNNSCMKDFSNSIVLMRGTVTILTPKASPKDGSELIASLTAVSDQYASTSDGHQM